MPETPLNSDQSGERPTFRRVADMTPEDLREFYEGIDQATLGDINRERERHGLLAIDLQEGPK